MISEVNLGAPVCEKLRNIYFKDIPWVKCCRDVADKFTELKAVARKFWPDKSSLEIVQELYKFSESDIMDALDKDCRNEKLPRAS